ncbi:hypothetical protein FGO68_gene1323 [Halteria grandinella]|uniref:CBM20 domain-containing protein n=1 Tax=Halteria grandinella TaxID=5974 RepID=A0A8J8SZX5_HALGN|nr:hypothetical protein FGO68_gene1323 [Halteria grandinella]
MDYKQKRIPSSPIFHLEEKKSEDGGSEPFLTPKELSEVHARTGGITIASLSDLAKLSFLEIKNLPLGKCRGEIFEAALKQAIELEKEGQVKVHNAKSAKVEGISKGQVVTMNQMVPFIQKHHPAVHKIKFIVFQIQYKCQFGQEFAVTGSSQILGSWQGLNALSLVWHSDHNWKSNIIPVEELAEDYFEYKFIIRESQNTENIISWQPGGNCIFDIKKLSLVIKQLNLYQQVTPQLGNMSPYINLDRRTRIRLETSNAKGSKGQIGDVLVLNVGFQE